MRYDGFNKRNGGRKMKRQIEFEKNKNVFTVGQLLIGLTMGVVVISMLFTILSHYVEFNINTLFGRFVDSMIGTQNNFTAIQGWLAIDIAATSTHFKQIALYSSGDRLMLLLLIFYVITKFKKIVKAFEDKKQIFLEENIKSLQHIGHGVLFYMLVSFTYNFLCSGFLHMLLNSEFEKAGLHTRASIIVGPYFFIYCLVSAGAAYALSGIFKKGLELREDSESFV